jgi:hypothetical protein
MGATQEFNQKVIQKYGWSAHFETTTDGNGYWFVTVVIGFGKKRHVFSSQETDMKKGKEFVSKQAMQGLAAEIAAEDAKACRTLTEMYVILLIY